MSDATLERPRAEVLAFAEPERAELAHLLVQSLDHPVDPDAAVAWEQEILRRLTEIEDAAAQLVDREGLRRRMRPPAVRRRSRQ